MPDSIVLELRFGTQGRQIAVHDGDRPGLAGAPIGDAAVMRLQRAVDLRLIPTLRVSDIGQTEVVLLGPKERHGIEYLMRPQNVA